MFYTGRGGTKMKEGKEKVSSFFVAWYMIQNASRPLNVEERKDKKKGSRSL
jgi:hypothetical protein